MTDDETPPEYVVEMEVGARDDAVTALTLNGREYVFSPVQSLEMAQALVKSFEHVTGIDADDVGNDAECSGGDSS